MVIKAVFLKTVRSRRINEKVISMLKSAYYELEPGQRCFLISRDCCFLI